MTFRVGDRVTTKDYFAGYKQGTIIEILTTDHALATDKSPWCYVSWDNRTADAYAHKVAGKIYRYVYGFYGNSLKLVEPDIDLENDPRLPTDPRLRGIAIKIRDIENRFKDRHNTSAYNNKERILSDFQRSKVCTG
jgi:hypothetical protein